MKIINNVTILSSPAELRIVLPTIFYAKTVKIIIDFQKLTGEDHDYISNFIMMRGLQCIKYGTYMLLQDGEVSAGSLSSPNLHAFLDIPDPRFIIETSSSCIAEDSPDTSVLLKLLLEQKVSMFIEDLDIACYLHASEMKNQYEWHAGISSMHTAPTFIHQKNILGLSRN